MGDDLDGEAFARAVGTRLARARRERGWTQERLAEELGVDATTLSRLETGKRPLGLVLLARAARKLGVSPAVLVDEGSGPEPPRPAVHDDILPVWRSLEPRDRRLVLDLARSLAGRERTATTHSGLAHDAAQDPEVAKAVTLLVGAEPTQRATLLRVLFALLTPQ